MERAKCDVCGAEVDGVVFPAVEGGQVLLDGSEAFYKPCGHKLQARARQAVNDGIVGVAEGLAPPARGQS